MLHALLWHLCQQLLRGLAARGIDAVRGDLRQWREHKGAFGHARMRDDQIIQGYTQVIIKDDVDIYGARPVAESSLPAER